MNIFHDTEKYRGVSNPPFRRNRMLRKIWNLLKGLHPDDLNGDGVVDIKDKFVAAEIKSGKKVTNVFKPSIDHNGDGVDHSEGPYK